MKATGRLFVFCWKKWIQNPFDIFEQSLRREEEERIFSHEGQDGVAALPSTALVECRSQSFAPTRQYQNIRESFSSSLKVSEASKMEMKMSEDKCLSGDVCLMPYICQICLQVSSNICCPQHFLSTGNQRLGNTTIDTLSQIHNYSPVFLVNIQLLLW